MTRAEPLNKAAEETVEGQAPQARIAENSPPVAPEAPDPMDCCGGGCVSCVYDVHDAALERYEAALAAWRTRQAEARS